MMCSLTMLLDIHKIQPMMLMCFPLCVFCLLLLSMGSSQSSEKLHCNRYLDGQGPPSLVQQGTSHTHLNQFSVSVKLSMLFFYLLLDHLTKAGLLSVQLVKRWMGWTEYCPAASQRARWPGWSSTETWEDSLMTTLFRSTTNSQMESSR